MKTFCLTMIIAVFVLLSTNGIQAQGTQTKLNQVELMKQFIGSWKSVVAKDTTSFYDIKSYGSGLECNFKYVSKGKTVMEGKQIWGYSKGIDKYIVSAMVKGMDLELYSIWFTSKDKYIQLSYGDISNPENAAIKVEGVFKSPVMAVETTIINNKPVKTDTFNREKK